MGTTGSSAEVAMNQALPHLLSRVREFTLVPLAVGFGVATRHHFEVVADAGADGVVIGSRLVSVIKSAPAGKLADTVREYCSEISQNGVEEKKKKLEGTPTEKSGVQSITAKVSELASNVINGNGTSDGAPDVASPLPIPPADGQIPTSADTLLVTEPAVLPGRFGPFGGQYVPEALVESLAELEAAHNAALADPAFWKEFEGFYGYMNRPSSLYLAERLTESGGGAKVWLKREDL